jgi:hypothetical protein
MPQIILHVPGQTCNNAVLNKVLLFDLLCQTLSPVVLTDSDATMAFDRVIAVCPLQRVKGLMDSLEQWSLYVRFI